MPRGIAPVAAILLIASAYSRYGTIPTAPTGTSAAIVAEQSSSTDQKVQRTGQGRSHKRSANTTSTPTDHCVTPSACLPRSDLGPWTAVCTFTSQHLGSTAVDRSPIVEENLGLPTNEPAKRLANQSNLQPAGATSAPDLRKSKANKSAKQLAKETKPRSATSTTAKDLPDTYERWCLTPGLKIKITPIIVTLPDPIESHLALDFDRRIEAIEAAALDAGFLIDQFWIPWIGADATLPEDLDQARIERVLRQLRLRQPGLQIFRSRGDEDRALFVFLVGETITLGVNKAQLSNAIQDVRDVLKATNEDPINIPILGPSSSGAIPSLIEELRKNQDEARPFLVVPSTATDTDLLKKLLQNRFIAPHAVVYDDQVALRRFVKFAGDELATAPREIAILSESQTAYGSALQSLPPDGPKNDNDPTLLRLTFPREIYRLRSVYPDQATTSAPANGQVSPSVGGLPLNLRLAPGVDDDVPSFSRDELPISQESVLELIAETIHRRKIKMVGVAATDVFDTLFLLRYLKESCPDVRLFVLDSDLLLVRATDSLSLQGTLAVTNFTLSPTVQTWEEADSASDTGRTHLFPSRTSEATYDGLTYLINPQGPPDRLHDLRSFEATEPLLWVTVVSRNGFQPIHVLLHGSDGDAVLPFVPLKTIAQNFHLERPPGGYLWLCAIVLLVTLAQVMLVRAAKHNVAPLLGWLLEFLHIDPDSPHKEQKAFFLASSFLSLAIVQCVVVFPMFYIFSKIRETSDGWWYALLSLLMVSAIGASLVSFFSVKQHISTTSSYRKLLWLTSSIVFLFYFVWIWFLRSPQFDSGLFMIRSLDLSNSVSPVPPYLFLLTGFYIWCMVNVRRIHLWEARRPPLKLNALDKAYSARLTNVVAGLAETLGSFLPSQRSPDLILAVIVFLIMLRPANHVISFEPFSIAGPRGTLNLYDLLYIGCLLLFTAFLVSSLYRFLRAWDLFQKMLRRLERLPLREAFDRLPKKYYSWTPLWQSGGARRTFVLQTRSVETLRKLLSLTDWQASSPRLKKYLENILPRLAERSERLLEAEADGRIDLEPEYTVCLNAFGNIADHITRDFLIQEWDKRGACDSLAYSDQKESEKPDRGIRFPQTNQLPLEDQAIVIAEEFVALRFVAYFRYVGLQLRNLLSFISAGFVLSVISLRSYPFLGSRTIGWALSLLFFVLGTPIVVAFAQMDRDAVLSRLSDTEPGKLDRAFYLRLVSYGALPLLTVLASQFPTIGRFLFSWLQPAVEALH
jgi:hypothetical protein